MVNCIFYSLFFSLFLSLSFGSLRLSQINRVFLSLYKGLFEASVITVDRNGEPIYPYFDQGILRRYIFEYLSKKMDQYTTNYFLDISFYKEDGVSECATYDLARNVKLFLTADINYLFKYSKHQSFSIKDVKSL